MQHLYDGRSGPHRIGGDPLAGSRLDPTRLWPAFFAAMGKGYDDVAFAGAALTRVAERETTLIGRAIGSGDGRALLDVGAGTGRFTGIATAQRWAVTAFDAAPEMLGVVRDRYPSVRTVEGTLGETLPFADAGFEAVIAMRVVKYVPDTEAALAEIARVVAPGGSVVFDLANGRSLARFGYPSGSVSFVSPRAVRPLLERVGLLPVAIFAGPRLPHHVYRHLAGARGARAVELAERALDALLPPGSGARNVVIHAVRSR
jgi:SAM-dependent methyltransferase